jgi:hypothetical protein
MKKIETARLTISELGIETLEFTHFLLNEVEIDTYRKNRNEDVHGYGSAKTKVLTKDKLTVWVISLKKSNVYVGIVSFHKPDYLDTPVIRCELFPEYRKRGYAFEALRKILHFLIIDRDCGFVSVIARDTDNTAMNLLRGLGFQRESSIKINSEYVQRYRITRDHLTITQMINLFFSSFSTEKGKGPQLEILADICHPSTRILNVSEGLCNYEDLNSFIKAKKMILTDGTMCEFEEQETELEIKIEGDIAHCYTAYKKHGNLFGKFFNTVGHKFFQLAKCNDEWKIFSIAWQDHINELGK